MSKTKKKIKQMTRKHITHGKKKKEKKKQQPTEEKNE